MAFENSTVWNVANRCWEWVPSRRTSHRKRPFSKLSESGWDCEGESISMGTYSLSDLSKTIPVPEENTRPLVTNFESDQPSCCTLNGATFLTSCSHAGCQHVSIGHSSGTAEQYCHLSLKQLWLKEASALTTQHNRFASASVSWCLVLWFLPQPSKFILACDRHWGMFDCILRSVFSTAN